MRVLRANLSGFWLYLGLIYQEQSLLPSVSAIPAQGDTPQCREVTFNVSGHAINRNISTAAFTDPRALTTQLKADEWPRFAVSGAQQLVGWYCEPTARDSNNDKLQILWGSITSNRDMWNGLGGSGFMDYEAYRPDMYSWVRYAAARGYHTLSMDRLGSGKSSAPDPMNVVQGPYEYAIYHDLAQQLKNRKTAISKSFSQLFWVGNSYGSITGNQMSHLYPNDFDAYVLTGFTKQILPSLPGIARQNTQPAAKVRPIRFKDLSPGYLVSTSEKTRTESFFGDPSEVDFDPVAAYLFFEREDVVSAGQFITVYSDTVKAPEYRGRVLVLTGEQDQAVCGQGSSALGSAKCGTLLKETGELFPNAEYNWKSIERTGHAITLHYSAPYAFEIAHAFLAGRKFKGEL